MNELRAGISTYLGVIDFRYSRWIFWMHLIMYRAPFSRKGTVEPMPGPPLGPKKTQ
jgi:hypothetical protein